MANFKIGDIVVVNSQPLNIDGHVFDNKLNGQSFHIGSGPNSKGLYTLFDEHGVERYLPVENFDLKWRAVKAAEIMAYVSDNEADEALNYLFEVTMNAAWMDDKSIRAYVAGDRNGRINLTVDSIATIMAKYHKRKLIESAL